LLGLSRIIGFVCFDYQWNIVTKQAISARDYVVRNLIDHKIAIWVEFFWPGIEDRIKEPLSNERMKINEAKDVWFKAVNMTLKGAAGNVGIFEHPDVYPEVFLTRCLQTFKKLLSETEAFKMETNDDNTDLNMAIEKIPIRKWIEEKQPLPEILGFGT